MRVILVLTAVLACGTAIAASPLPTEPALISYAYRHRMKPLKPDADKVVAAIRSYLHIQ